MVAAIRSSSYLLFNVITIKRIFEWLNSSIMYSKMRFFDNTRIGGIITRLSSDMFVVDFELSWHVQCSFEELNLFLGYPIGCVIISPWIALPMLLLM